MESLQEFCFGKEELPKTARNVIDQTKQIESEILEILK